jgi:dynein heavy chain
MIRTLEMAIEAGQPVLLENMDEKVDAVLANVYGRAIIKRGKSRYLRLGDKELSLHNNFNLYLHTKLSNPHYPPEIQAECALINFSVTEDGLEDQLLA